MRVDWSFGFLPQDETLAFKILYKMPIKWTMEKLVFLPLAIVLLLSFNVEAAPPALTYQGRILKSNGVPLEHSNVSFIFQITSPNGQCVIYQEHLTGINMVNSGGVFDVPIGTGAIGYPTSGGFTILDAFANSGSFTCGACSGYSCSVGTSSYSPVSGDGRLLRVQFNDGVAWQQITPDNVIRSVPYAAFAKSAERLGTYSATDFVQVTKLPSAACSSGQVVFFDGSNFSCVTDAGGAGVISDVLAGTGITVTGTTSKTVAANFGTTAGTIAQGNDSRLVGAFQTSTTLGSDLSGTLPNPTVVQIQGRSVLSSAPTSNQVFKWNGSAWAPSTLSSADLSNDSDLLKASNMPANCAANQTLTFSSPTGTWVCSNITGFLSGTGTTGYMPYYSSASGLANSPIFTDGSNIGIGTTSPSVKLSVSGLVESISGGFKFPDGTIQSTAAAGSGGTVFGAWVSASHDTIYQAASDGIVMASFVPSGNGDFRFSGDVGTSSPPTSPRQVSYSNTSGHDRAMSFAVRKGEYWRVRNVGSSTGTATVWWIPMVAGTPSTSAAGSTGQVQFNNGGVLSTNSNLVFDNANSRLGVGTSSPAATVDVAGEVRATTLRAGSLAVTGGSPAAGKVLVSDASGNATWTQGAVGEKVVGNLPGSATPLTLGNVYSSRYIDLTPGVWQIFLQAESDLAVSDGYNHNRWWLSSSSTVINQSTNFIFLSGSTWQAASGVWMFHSGQVMVEVTSNVRLYLWFYLSSQNNSTVNLRANQGLEAVRLR